MWAEFKSDIASNRNIPEGELNDIVNNYKGYNANSSLSNKLIDKISYFDEVEKQIKRDIDIRDKKKISYISLPDYLGKVRLSKGSGKQKVAVVYMEGNVSYGSDENGTINEQRYPELLQKIEQDTSIKAVVLRINSGGGSSLTSDIIWHHVENIKKTGKPVVASFGDYAASGGYYVACGADTIVAMPNTLTGSIGVFMMLPNVQKLLNEKIGITFDTVKTAPMAASFQTVYPLSEQEKAILTNSTNDVYEQFLNRVSLGRNMDRDAVHQVAQGRVWTGSKAQNLGLVDVLGDLDTAIDIAAEMAEIDKYAIKEYPKMEKDPFLEVIKSINKEKNALTQIKKDLNQEKIYKIYRDMKPLTEKGVQMRVPYYFEWN
jgi:protease IV